jgi:hypothetical protein
MSSRKVRADFSWVMVVHGLKDVLYFSIYLIPRACSGLRTKHPDIP